MLRREITQSSLINNYNGIHNFNTVRSNVRVIGDFVVNTVIPSLIFKSSSASLELKNSQKNDSHVLRIICQICGFISQNNDSRYKKSFCKYKTAAPLQNKRQRNLQETF